MIDLRHHLRTDNETSLPLEVALSILAGGVLMALAAILALKNERSDVQFLFIFALTHGAAVGSLWGRGCDSGPDAPLSAIAMPIDKKASLFGKRLPIFLIWITFCFVVISYTELWAWGHLKSSPREHYAICSNHWIAGALIGFCLALFGQIQRGSQKRLSPTSYGVFTGARVSVLAMLTSYFLYLLIAQPEWLTSFNYFLPHYQGDNRGYTLGWEPVWMLGALILCVFTCWFLFIEQDPVPQPIVLRHYREPSHKGAVS